MAQLSSLISFTAGTPAIANDVNQNFTDIRNHINGANIDTENIAATLTSRAGGPILYLNQASENQIALSIQNSQTNTAMQILQTAALADSSKAVLKISDTITQTAGKAELWLSLDASSTIPGILVEHGANTSLSLTKTQLSLFSGGIQATSTLLSLPNIATSNNITATAPVSDAIAVRVAGRSTDNQSVLDFTSNDKLTQYVALNAKSTGLDIKFPDTADSLTVQFNNVTKAVIDNNGIDGQYVKTASIPKTAMVNVGQQSATVNYYKDITSPWAGEDIPGATVTITTTGRPVLIIIDCALWRQDNRNSGYEEIESYLYLLRGASTLKSYVQRLHAADDAGPVAMHIPFTAVYFDPIVAGTYTYKLRAGGTYQANFGQYSLTDLKITAYEL